MFKSPELTLRHTKGQVLPNISLRDFSIDSSKNMSQTTATAQGYELDQYMFLWKPFDFT